MQKTTNTKLIISGSTLEVYLYTETPVAYGFTIPEKQRRIKNKILVIDEESKLHKIESRKKGMQRSRSVLRRLINSNAWKWRKIDSKFYLPVFVTLTFAENIQDTKTANLVFSKFIKRLNYYVSGSKKNFLKYVVVTEFQERGAIHYHAIFFNLEHIWKDKLAEIWGQGFVDIKKIESVNNAGAYVCKYMAKEFEDERLDGKKRYFSSRGLVKPTQIRDQDDAQSILSQIPKDLMRVEKEFDSKMGKVKYRQYQVDKKSSFTEIVPEIGFYL